VRLRTLEHELGLSWVVEEPLERASHALVADGGRVWLIDRWPTTRCWRGLPSWASRPA
jgi:hypothetical protein